MPPSASQAAHTVAGAFVAGAVLRLDIETRARVLAACGVNPLVLESPGARVDAAAFGRLWLAVARELDDEFFGLDFAAPSGLDALPAPEAAFCTLGTTIKQAGSKEAFRAVDFDAVVAFAKAARARGARAFVHVTALGADTKSMVFYNAVKGQVEDAVAGLGFDRVVALRPSFLDGERTESRPGERFALAVGRTLGPLLGKYRPTPVSAVAAAMLDAARSDEPGRHEMEANAILRFVVKA